MKVIKKLKKGLMIMLTLMVAFTVVSSNITFAMSNNNTEEIEETSAEAKASLKDLNNQTISFYDGLKNIADDDTRYVGNGGNIIPITDWKRSDVSRKEYVIRGISGHNAKDWMWSDVQGIGLSVTNQEKVWDGSRLVNSGVNHVATKDSYLGKNQVTAMEGNLYDSLTWDHKGEGDEQVTIHRLQGKFTLPEIESGYNPNDYAYTIHQVTPNNSNKVYINDNIYVFIYPDDNRFSITNENFIEHLAFWTGTTQNKFSVGEFHDRTNTTATHGEKEGLGTLTDGWYTEAVKDNASSSILRYYNSLGVKNYIVDIFVEDFMNSGGTYRFEIEQQKTERYDVQFRKVDERDIHKGLEGASFELIEKNTLVPYYANSDENGIVNFKVLPGNYTLKETKAPDGYKTVNKSWDIRVDRYGNITYDSDIKNGSIYNGEGYHYITNEKNIVGDFSLKKVDSNSKPLPGAQFTLYEKNGNDVIKTIETTADGIIRFTNIPVGDYVLKETKAPSGYVELEEVWNVSVDYNGKVKITDSKNNPISEKSEIINKTEEEIIAESLYKNKTAKVEDYENRVYEIDLNAYTTGSTTTENMQDIDVMFVLDRSPSMSDTGWGCNPLRKEWLESAVKSFLNEMADMKKSGKLLNSRIAIVEFGGRASDITEGWKKTESEIREQANKYKLGYNSSTNMKAGLDKAYDNYYNGDYGYNKQNKQIIITLTDGGNNAGGGWGISADQAAINSAEKIRNAVNDISFYGIGLGISENSTPGKFMQELIKDTNKLWFVSDNDGGDKLKQVFKDIFHSSTITDLYKDAKIIDYIDSRFQVCVKEDETYKVYTDEEVKTEGEIELGNGGFLKYDEVKKCQYIEWTQDIGADETNDEFNKKFYIKAKEDFIGGNMIPTNGDKSGVTVNSENKNVTVYFPKPTVNVKLLNINGNDKTTKFFIEDMIDPSNLITDLNGTFSIIELDGNKVSLPTLTNQEMANLLRGEAVTKEYSYANTNDNVGYFTYYLKEKISLEEHEAIEVGTNVEKYHLNVKYTSYTEEQRKQKFDDSYSIAIGDKVSFKDAQSNNIVDVVAGSIDITKEITKESNWNEVLEGAPIFSFKIDRYVDGKETPVDTYYRTISFKGESEKTLKAEILDNLPRGKYVITELGTQRYTNIDVEGQLGQEGCTVDEQQKTITFYIGKVGSDEEYTALNGKAKFTNNKTGDTGKRTDTDVILNRFTKDENGNWTVQQITKPQNPANSIIQRGKGLVNSFISLFEF